MTDVNISRWVVEKKNIYIYIYYKYIHVYIYRDI